MATLQFLQVAQEDTLIPAQGVINACTYVDARVLAASTNETVTVPTGARFVFFSSTGNFYVNFQSGTAAIPSGDVTDGSASILNPAGRYINEITQFGIIAPADTIVTMEFYK